MQMEKCRCISMFVQTHSDISRALVIGHPPSWNSVVVAHGTCNGCVISIRSSYERLGTRLTVQSGIMLNISTAVVFGDICAIAIAMKEAPSNRRKSEDIMTASQSECRVNWDIQRSMIPEEIRAGKADSRLYSDHIC